MTLQFSTAQQVNAGNGIKCLVYGPAGIGKTVLSATLPTPVLISAESGVLSLRQSNLEKLFGVGNPNVCYNMPIITVQSVDDLKQAYSWCTQSAEAKAFKSIALDSISEIAEVILVNAKALTRDPRQAYGEVLDKASELIRLFRDISDKHIYFSAKMEAFKDGLTGAIKYGPSMPGAKLGPALPYFFDEVFRLGVGKTDAGESFRFLQTQPDLQYEAKDRSGALAPIEYPFLSAIFQKVMA